MFFFDPGIILKWIFIISKSVCLLSCLFNMYSKAASMVVIPSARGCHAESLCVWGCWGCLVGTPRSLFLCCLLAHITLALELGRPSRKEVWSMRNTGREGGMEVHSLLTRWSLHAQIFMHHLRVPSPCPPPFSWGAPSDSRLKTGACSFH